MVCAVIVILQLRDEHAAAYGRLREIARRVGKVAADCKMPLDVEECAHLDVLRPAALPCLTLPPQPFAPWPASLIPSRRRRLTPSRL